LREQGRDPEEVAADVLSFIYLRLGKIRLRKPCVGTFLGYVHSMAANRLVSLTRGRWPVNAELSDERAAPVDFDAFSQRKNRGLLELTRTMRLTQGVEVDPRVVAQLTGLRASLVRNQATLQMHLDAVREVSAIIARSIQEVESDGTYSLIGPSRCK